MGTVYRHTQVSRVTVAGAGIACVAAVWWSLHMPEPTAVAVAVILALVLTLFSTLTVVVEDEAMVVFFGLGLIRRRIPLRRIRDVQMVRMPWYYGWGIRLTPSGWLWNVSGLGGVEIQFDDGHRFRVGSDEPNRLAEALLHEIRALGLGPH